MTQDTFPKSEMEKLHHIRDDYGGSYVPLIPVYDPEYEGERDDEWGDLSDWYFWIVHDDKLKRMKGYPSQNTYFGTKAADWRDTYYPFFDFYTQRALFTNVSTLTDYLLTDVRHLSTSIAKIGLFDHLYQTGTFNPDRFVRSEIEYIITTCRSIYETLYSVIKNTWEFIEIPEKQQLPDDFKNVLTTGGEPVEVEYLREERKMPENLAQFFADEAEHFLTIREARDSIIHQGDAVEAIFRGSDGLSVRTEDTILSHFSYAWNEDDISTSGVGTAPLWPPIAYAMRTTINALNRFVSALLKDVDFPDPIAPGYAVFVRGDCTHYLPSLEYLIETDPYGVYIREDVRQRFIEEGGLPAGFPMS